MSSSPSTGVGSRPRCSEGREEPSRMPDLHGSIRDWWDADAHHYDRSVGHAISDPVEAAAWRAELRRLLQTLPSRVLDVGAGTGSLSLLAAGIGYQVQACHLSAGMIVRACVTTEGRGSTNW